MKGSARARTVIAAPVNAETTVIKGLCKRGGEKNVLYFHITSNAHLSNLSDLTKKN
jgi:hypothetical protein